MKKVSLLVNYSFDSYFSSRSKLFLERRKSYPSLDSGLNWTVLKEEDFEMTTVHDPVEDYVRGDDDVFQF